MVHGGKSDDLAVQGQGKYYRARSIGWVCDKDVGLRSAVQTVCQPGIDCAEGESAFIVCLLDLFHVFQQPQQFGGRRVRREWQTAEILELVRAFASFQLVYHLVRPCVGPYYRVVQRLASVFIPYAGCLALIRDAHGFDVGKRVALGGELFAGLVNAFLRGGDEFERVMFVPSDENISVKTILPLRHAVCPAHPEWGYICLNST